MNKVPKYNFIKDQCGCYSLKGWLTLMQKSVFPGQSRSFSNLGVSAKSTGETFVTILMGISSFSFLYFLCSRLWNTIIVLLCYYKATITIVGKILEEKYPFLKSLIFLDTSSKSLYLFGYSIELWSSLHKFSRVS